MTINTNIKCQSFTRTGSPCCKNAKPGYKHCTQHVAVHLVRGLRKSQVRTS